MSTKSILKSKTFWFNLLTALATAAADFGGILPPSALIYVTVASALANVYLRTITTSAVHLKE